MFSVRILSDKSGIAFSMSTPKDAIVGVRPILHVQVESVTVLWQGMMEFCQSTRLQKDLLYLHIEVEIMVVAVLSMVVPEQASLYTITWVESSPTVITNDPSKRVVRK